VISRDHQAHLQELARIRWKAALKREEKRNECATSTRKSKAESSHSSSSFGSPIAETFKDLRGMFGMEEGDEGADESSYTHDFVSQLHLAASTRQQRPTLRRKAKRRVKKSHR
jgi:hypothetical protein